MFKMQTHMAEAYLL